MYNNFVKSKPDSKPEKAEKKERRKPVALNFVPKRLAVSVEPPMIILEYMVPDSGKLYHHKMRLESKMQETFDVQEILAYVKKKHSAYFSNGNPKLKDHQIEELIQKVVSQYEEYEESGGAPQDTPNNQQMKLPKVSQAPLVKDFDFLDDEDEDDDQYGKEEWDLEMGEDADIV